MSIERKNRNYSVTQTLNEFVRNYDWQQGFQEVVTNSLPRLADGRVDLNTSPGYASLWLTLSASFENEAGQIYERIANMVGSVSDVESCSIDALASMAEMLGVEDIKLLNINYPLEIKEILDVLSVAKSRLINDQMLADSSYNELIVATLENTADAMEGYLTGWVNTSGSVWETSQGTAAQDYHASAVWSTDQYDTILSARVDGIYDIIDDQLYLDYIEDQISGTLIQYVTLDRLIDEMYSSIYNTFEYSSTTILDTPEDSTDINQVKLDAGVPLSFFANSITDGIIRGDTRFEAYSFAEQQVINAVLDEREELERYGDQPTVARKYKYDKERKVREYVRFIENINLIVSNASIESSTPDYDIITGDDIKFFDYVDGTPVSGVMITNVTHFLRNICVDISYKRENLRTIVQKHQMIGTEQALTTMISEYLYRDFSDPEAWRMHIFPELSAINPILAGLNVNTISGSLFNNISVVEYNDSTEYLNLSASSYDSSADVNERFWEDPGTVNLSENTAGEVSTFYHYAGLDDVNLEDMNEFLSYMYNLGAISATQADLSPTYLRGYNHLLTELSGYPSTWLGTDVNMAMESRAPFALEESIIIGYENPYGAVSAMFLKYFADPSGTIPWANGKNTVHPSIAHIPYLYNLQAIINLDLVLENIYSFVPKTFDELSSSLSAWYDIEGNTINHWRSDYETYSIYRDEYQFANNWDIEGDLNEAVDYDGPFYFPALSAYLDSPSTFISNIDDWYGHMELSDTELDKIEWQLTNHETEIRNLANKKIYQFAIDRFGNQYTLFKDDQHFDTLGELWVKYQNHPISFPITNNNSSKNTQIDTESYYVLTPSFEDNAKECYDFGIMTLESTTAIWMYSANGAANGNRTGRFFFADIQFVDSEKNKFIAHPFKGNSSNFSLSDRSETHIGVYRTHGEFGPAMVYVSLQSMTPHPTEADVFIAAFVYRGYDDTNGWRIRYKYARAKYNEFSADDGHNPWKLSKSDDLLTISYESELPGNLGAPSGLFLGSDGSGYYDSRYNTYKHGFHNGISTFDFPLLEGVTFPNTYETDHYIGYNDLTYQSIQAWEGWAGDNDIPSGSVHNYNLNSDDYVKLQFLGVSDPSTSGRFDVGPIQMLCYNDNDEHFGLWASNVYVSWTESTGSWSSTREAWSSFPEGWIFEGLSEDELSGFMAWDDTASAFHEFTEPGQTWTVGTIDNDQLYSVTVTYNGPGCQNMSIEFSSDEENFEKGYYTGQYWVRATHYADVLYSSAPNISAEMLNIDPTWSIGKEVYVIDETDLGGSVLIHNSAAARAETIEPAIITDIVNTTVALSGSNMSTFTVGKTITITER